MNELFTFNTQQFEASMRRPSSTDNPPNIRKRVIKSIISKRLLQMSDPSEHHEKDSLNQIKKRQTPTKKVTFSLQKYEDKQEDPIYEKLQITKKTKSFEKRQVKLCEVNHLWKKIELSRCPLQDIKNERKTYFHIKRPLSNAESRNLQRETTNNEVKQIIKPRQKRIFSLKHSPKIVPVSDSKLPKVFKIKYMVDNNIKRPEQPKINLRQILSCEIDRKLLMEQGNLSAKMHKASQLKKMLYMEQKIFQKLYLPRQ